MTLPDIETEGERIAGETWKHPSGMYTWTDLVGAVQTAIDEERKRHDPTPTISGEGEKLREADGNEGRKRNNPPTTVSPTDAQVREAMQTAWDDFCDDAQAIPGDIYRKGRKTFFQAGTWANHTAMHLRAALATPDAAPIDAGAVYGAPDINEGWQPDSDVVAEIAEKPAAPIPTPAPVIGAVEATAVAESVTVQIPAGMVPWDGGEQAPDDWDGGPVFIHDDSADGDERFEMRPGYTGEGAKCWRRGNNFVDIIAYTPAALSPAGLKEEG